MHPKVDAALLLAARRIPRGGLAAGCDFALYEAAPSLRHARFCVLVADASSGDAAHRDSFTWTQLQAAARAAAAIRKPLLLCYTMPGACWGAAEVRLCAVDRWLPNSMRETKVSRLAERLAADTRKRQRGEGGGHANDAEKG